MSDRIISKKELRSLIPLSDTQISRLEKARKFPKRIRFAPGRVGWLLSEIDAHIEACSAARDEPSGDA